MFNGEWNQQFVDEGPTLKSVHFVNIEEETFEFFRAFSNTTSLANTFSASAYDLVNFQGNFDETGTIAYFDWFVEGNIVSPYNTNFPFNFDGYYLYKLAFNKNTGIEQGYRLELNFKGTNNGKSFEIYYEQEVTLDGYTLPDFYFEKPHGIPGFKWYSVLIGLSIVIIPAIIYKRRK